MVLRYWNHVRYVSYVCLRRTASLFYQSSPAEGDKPYHVIFPPWCLTSESSLIESQDSIMGCYSRISSRYISAFHLLFCVVLIAQREVYCLDNGLALTPPMGWLSWERFTCNVDCQEDPLNCISERLYMDMADRLAADGYKELGYEYVNIDDCWMEKQRDQQGRLTADAVRFPSGIKALADYVHSKGLKLGIYIDCGTKTCAGYPGSYGHFETDAQTFADWGVDMLKVDGCYADPKEMDELYPQISVALNNTGRPILFSCSWPDYQRSSGMTPNYTAIAEYCNIWRNFDDIEDSWQSILSIVDYYAATQDDLVPAAGPGHFNDPDMILSGNFGLSFDEARSQFALWSIMASPLLMSNDLRTIAPDFKNLLLNKDVIAVNQDKLGMMGKRIYSKSSIEIWKRPITPAGNDGQDSYALVVFNRRTLGGPVKVTVQLASIGMNNSECYRVRDVFSEQQLGNGLYCPSDDLTVVVNPSGVSMVIAEAVFL